MEQNSQFHKENLRGQIREAYARLVYTYTTHLKQAGRLTSLNKNIKHWQIVLSAISTGGFIGAVITNELIMTWFSGIVSTALLGLNLYFKDFNLAETIKQHRIVADQLWLLREKYLSLLTDLDTLPETEIMARRDALQNDTAEVYASAPSTDSKSYAAAQKALKSEEEQFFTDAEIDQLLPPHLRKTNSPTKTGS